MNPEALVAELAVQEKFFNTSTACLTEADSGYRPYDNAYTVANHVAHVALTIDWFLEGAFRPEGFDLDFEQHIIDSLAIESLDQARAMLARAYADAREVIGAKPAAELSAALPEGPVMSGQPVANIVGAIGDHTAHHRGALTVYSRLIGHTPEMPYA